MAGHAREMRPGVWELRAYVGRDPLTAKKRWKTKRVRARGRREAQRLADAFVVEQTGGGIGRPKSAITVGDLLERWFAARAASWSPSTAMNTRWTIDRRLVGLADGRVEDLRTIDLDEFYAALRERGGRNGGPLAPSTVVRVHGMLRLALDQAVRWELIDRNPADGAQPGRVRRPRITPPTAEQVGELLAAAAERDPELLAYLFLDAETGARRSELAALRLTDFGAGEVTIARALAIGLASDENARAYAGHYWPAEVERGRRSTALFEKETKTVESVRTIALSAATAALVEEQTARVVARLTLADRRYPRDGFLFPAPGDGRRPLRPDTWSHRFTRLRDDVGVACRLHDLRHFVATTLLTSGVDLATAAGRLGHGGGGKTTLAIYGHFLRAPDRAASDLMDRILRPVSDARSDEGIGAVVVPLRKSRA